MPSIVMVPTYGYSSLNLPHRRNADMAFVKKNPWIVIVAAFAILVVIGIATS